MSREPSLFTTFRRAARAGFFAFAFAAGATGAAVPNPVVTGPIPATVQPGNPAEFELVARCPTPDTALRFEQSIRAVISLAAATSARQPSTLGVLESIRIRREDRVIHVALSTPLDAISNLLP